MSAADGKVPGPASRRRWVVPLIALIAFAPVALAVIVYWLSPDVGRTNYGELLPTRPFPAVEGVDRDGRRTDLEAWRGKWVVLFAAPSRCDAACAAMLYATRQARTLQAGERERVVRVWLVVGAEPPAADALREHPDVETLRVPAEAPPPLPRGAGRIYLVDPLGNQVLAWPGDPDIKALAKDLSRVLRASRIG